MLPGGAAGLNYPSFAVVFDRSTRVITLTRTLTKVSASPETYTARVAAPAGVKVTVTPSLLKFSEVYERKTYSVRFESETADEANVQA
ncbi:hypothetical protein ZWY2020_002738 [Hordeum vulgare]|nr:hypothetical protein ZWY2020_002738 [Hordeum vulgare]